jgi:hypothetical protein
MISYPPPSTGTNHNLVTSVDHKPGTVVVWHLAHAPEGSVVYGYSIRAKPLKGWKHAPQAWWPELPGKCGEIFAEEDKRSNNKSRRKVVGTRMCKACKKEPVIGIKRYCNKCAKNRIKSKTKVRVAKYRVRCNENRSVSASV